VHEVLHLQARGSRLLPLAGRGSPRGRGPVLVLLVEQARQPGDLAVKRAGPISADSAPTVDAIADFLREGLWGDGAARLLVGDHGAIRHGAHGCRGYRKGSRE
jgi:hypothetical protein